MTSEFYNSIIILFALASLALLIPLWYAVYAYSAKKTKPLTRWEFGFISLVLTYGISVLIGIPIFLIEVVTIKLSIHLEHEGWHVASDILESFEDKSWSLWFGMTIVVGLLMPSKIEEFVARVDGSDREP